MQVKREAFGLAAQNAMPIGLACIDDRVVIANATVARESLSEARASIGRYLVLYNQRRPHSSLDGMTPDQAYYGHETCCRSDWQLNPGR